MGISTLCDYSRHFRIVEVAGGRILCSASGQLCPDARKERSVQVFGKTRTEIWIEKSFYSSDAKSGLDVKMGQYDVQTVGDGYPVPYPVYKVTA